MREKGLSHTGKSAPAAPTPEQAAIPSDSADSPQKSGPESAQAMGQAMGAIPRTDYGDFDIRIARDGTWFYKNSPIGRPALVKLFASVLKRDADGGYWLETPAERGRIVVEDAPFVAVEASFDGAGPAQQLTLRTNIDARVRVGAAHPLVMRGNLKDEPRPYVMLDGGVEALIARSAFYTLVDHAVPRVVDGARMLGVWSGGAFFALGPDELGPDEDPAP
jgi:hypothetical protein